MSFDRQALRRAIERHGRVARVVIAAVAGSAPREVGATMLVWPGGQSGTIGGGALELTAADHAMAALKSGEARLEAIPLGPALGQCCGGRVKVLTEIWDAGTLPDTADTIVARPLPGTAAEMPLAVRRYLTQARNASAPVHPAVLSGWMIEPVSAPTRSIWLYGAGHLGRAIVRTLAPLPEVEITWIDTAQGRFPKDIPDGVTPLLSTNPADAVRHAPAHAEHYILTYSHAFDLEICHRVLSQSFAFCGLVGSATKWARFRKRLADLGHGPQQIARITCPIGDPALGKHPHAIAIGIAAALLDRPAHSASQKDTGS